MEQHFANLKPERLWFYFSQILGIPHPSKKEEKIRDYLLEFAKTHSLQVNVDSTGNVLITKMASPGYESRMMVCLQGHMDMVCEKNSDVLHDFDADGIKTYLSEGWIKAKGTTLGADNGIALAAMLAILEDKSVSHGPLECLFTVDEESGLTGAFGLEPDFLKSRILLNLDNEDEGQFCIGCAGGRDTNARLPVEMLPVPDGYSAFQIRISGLKGGHSGEQIPDGLGNSIKILTRILWMANRKQSMELADIHGGNLRNAIPREAAALVVLPQIRSDEFLSESHNLASDIQAEFKWTDPGLKISFEAVSLPAEMISPKTTTRLLEVLYACPHGVLVMSPAIPGLVQTSTNLATIHTENGVLTVGTSQRSAFESQKTDVSNMVASAFSLLGAEVKQSNGYPGWTPNPESKIKDILVSTYKQTFSHQEPHVVAIHAGLECGLIGEKYPSMDMISFGPTIKNPHSPDEKVEVESVELFWKFLLEVLNAIPGN
ncbi:MAG: aminoacyl-histidine dipeptidase [Bacteroidetes bacterium]|nr:aminoacyl-histidine dipeptidase [Bacteroidota bacterium]MBU1717523.1 aminoacyl-histidine dipeptidase [Bacteroidota bacterium]